MTARWSWSARATLWFAVALILSLILHESAHAIVAAMLGVRGTLFSYVVDLGVMREERSGALALIALAGPVSSLAIGVVAWIVFKRARGTAAALPLLYFAAVGVTIFFGNLMSMAFVGDFSRVADYLNLPIAARWAGVAVGGAAAAGIQFWLGDQLVRFVPPDVTPIAGALGIGLVPVVVGTALVILISQPMPALYTSARIKESVFSFFVLAGAASAMRNRPASLERLQVRWPDLAGLVAAVVLVRLLVHGIPIG